jgi:hypothetical protein
VTDVRPGLHERQRVRMRRYLSLMAVCLALIVLAWTVVRLFWLELAIAMSVVAAVIPPVAAFVANRDSGA